MQFEDTRGTGAKMSDHPCCRINRGRINRVPLYMPLLTVISYPSSIACYFLFLQAASQKTTSVFDLTKQMKTDVATNVQASNNATSKVRCHAYCLEMRETSHFLPFCCTKQDDMGNLIIMLLKKLSPSRPQRSSRLSVYPLGFPLQVFYMSSCAYWAIRDIFRQVDFF